LVSDTYECDKTVGDLIDSRVNDTVRKDGLFKSSNGIDVSCDERVTVVEDADRTEVSIPLLVIKLR